MAEDRGAPKAPMIEAGRLFERTSSRGITYLAGRLGGLKVLVLPKRAGDEGEHSHVLFVTAPAPRDGGAR